MHAGLAKFLEMPITAGNPKILVVALSLDRGGTEQQLAAVLPRLQERGWTVMLYCLTRPGELADLVSASGVKVISLAADGGPRFVGARGVVRLMRSACKLFHLIWSEAPDIVHCYLPAPYLVGGTISLLLRSPIRVMSRRNLNDYLAKRVLLAKYELWLHGRMTAILGNSSRIVEELIDEEGCEPEKVGLIRNGVDLARVRILVERGDIRKHLDIADGDFVGVIVANLIPYKGHADLIQALGAIKSRMPRPWTVLCAGRDEGYQAELDRMLVEYNLAGNVRFLGARSDVPELLKAADIGMLCSHQEGFSNAVIEGMASGLPMVVTDVGGNPEAVRSGKDGLVVPAHNPQALGEAILALALDPERAKAMGKSAARRAEEQFSIERCVEHYGIFYSGLMSGKTASELAPAGQRSSSMLASA